MALNYGTIIQAPIRPATTEDTFPTFLSNEGKGGYQTVDTIAQRNLITAERRQSGMVVFVTETGLEYRLSPNMTTWTAIESSTGGSTAWDDITDKPTEFNPTTHGHAISEVTSLQEALDDKLEANLKGAPEGVAELDADGKILASQLPGSIDDIIEGLYVGSAVFNVNGTPVVPAANKLYVDTSTEKTYRWSGTQFTEVSASLALGDTAQTAYRGDRGASAYAHSQAAHAPLDAITPDTLGDKLTKDMVEAVLIGEIKSHTHPAQAAEDYPYTNEDYPFLTLQNQTLDFLLYTPLTVGVNPSTISLDLGDELDSLPVNLALNKTAAKMQLLEINLGTPQLPSFVNLKPQMVGTTVNINIGISTIIGAPVTANKTMPIIATTVFETVNKSIAVSFLPRRYWGYYGSDPDEAIITDLTVLDPNYDLSSTKAKTITITEAGAGRWLWYIYPQSFGLISNLVVGGFTVNWPYEVVQYTNPFGVITTMYAYHSPYPITAPSITLIVS